MQIAMLGAEGSLLGRRIAAHLNLTYALTPAHIFSDNFLLDGLPRTIQEARVLDSHLRKRAADLSALVWVRSHLDPDALEDVLAHYRSKIVEVPPTGDAFERTLDGLREMLFRG